MKWWNDCKHLHWSGDGGCICLCSSPECEQCQAGYENEWQQEARDGLGKSFRD